MKILWFSPVPLPAVCRALGLRPYFGGWWIHSMLPELATRQGMELAVAWPDRGCRMRRSFVVDGVTYYIFPEPGRFVQGGGVLRKIIDQLEFVLGPIRDERMVAEAVGVVEDFQPDLVQAFGSEHFFGLIAPLIRQPLVIWIQCFLDVYRHHFFGSMNSLERLRYPKLLWDYWRMVAKAEREREIYRRCRYFIGRTGGWDKAHQMRLKPEGKYYPIRECMRPEFYTAAPWRREEARGVTVYTTASGSLLKGTDVLVQAVALLRRRHPEIRLRVAGLLERNNTVARRMFRMVDQLGLSAQVEFLGQLDSTQIVDELKRARVFVLPSFIENGSNSLAEAQLVGTPVVSSFVGGLPESVAEGETGLLFQAGDSATLAGQIARILGDDNLAMDLSSRARDMAFVRYSTVRNVDVLLAAYNDILDRELHLKS